MLNLSPYLRNVHKLIEKQGIFLKAGSYMLFIFLMSISLSIDALGIGISYRLKGIVIPAGTKLIIGLVSALIMQGSLMIGSYLYSIMPTEVIKLVGVGVLILIGVAFIRNSLYGGEDTTYDFNHSRAIDPIEGIFLAVALSADSISSGIAIASTGLSSPWLSVLVGVMQVLFLMASDVLLSKSNLAQRMDTKISGLLSGGLLIFIGVVRWFS